MLARIAQSLYWTGRYIERSEHLARYLRVQYFSIFDTPNSQNREFILRSIQIMYGISLEENEEIDEQQLLFDVGLNPNKPVSLLSTVFAARENARSVRYTISTELWEEINQYYLFMKEYNVDFYRTRGLYDLTIKAAKHCSIFRSYADHTLIHDEIWMFIELGIYLERAAQIARILSSKVHDIQILSEGNSNVPLQRYQWTVTLKVLEAFDMHRRLYRKSSKEQTVVSFLTSHPRFPRSIAYSLNRIHTLVSDLSHATKFGESLVYKSGKILSYFQYVEYNEIKNDLAGFLGKAVEQIYELHAMIEKEYFAA